MHLYSAITNRHLNAIMTLHISYSLVPYIFDTLNWRSGDLEFDHPINKNLVLLFLYSILLGTNDVQIYSMVDIMINDI